MFFRFWLHLKIFQLFGSYHILALQIAIVYKGKDLVILEDLGEQVLLQSHFYFTLVLGFHDAYWRHSPTALL